MKHERHWTLDQPSAAIPWVAEMVSRMRAAREQLGDEEARAALTEAAPANGGGEPGVGRLRGFVALRNSLRGVHGERRGVARPRSGLVDFPAIRDGEEIYLCWEEGELEIGYWHDLESGYGGRSRSEERAAARGPGGTRIRPRRRGQRAPARLASARTIRRFIAWTKRFSRECIRAWKYLDGDQRVAAVGALLLVISTFGSFTFVEAAVALVGLAILLLLKKRADGRMFHLPFGDGLIIMVGGAWSAVLIIIRLFDRPLGQNLLALVCCAIIIVAGLRIRVRRPIDDLPRARAAAAAGVRSCRRRRRGLRCRRHRTRPAACGAAGRGPSRSRPGKSRSTDPAAGRRARRSNSPAGRRQQCRRCPTTATPPGRCRGRTRRARPRRCPDPEPGGRSRRRPRVPGRPRRLRLHRRGRRHRPRLPHRRLRRHPRRATRPRRRARSARAARARRDRRAPAADDARGPTRIPPAETASTCRRRARLIRSRKSRPTRTSIRPSCTAAAATGTRGLRTVPGPGGRPPPPERGVVRRSRRPRVGAGCVAGWHGGWINR